MTNGGILVDIDNLESMFRVARVIDGKIIGLMDAFLLEKIFSKS